MRGLVGGRKEAALGSKDEEDTEVIIGVIEDIVIEASEEAGGSKDEEDTAGKEVVGVVTVDVVKVVGGEDTEHLTNEAIEVGDVVEEPAK